MTQEESTRMQTARSYLAHFATLDLVLLDSLITPDYEHIMAPASLHLPAHNRASLLAFIGDLRKVLAGIPITPTQVWESEGSNSVVVWATSSALFREEVVRGVLREEDGGGKERGEVKEEDMWTYEGEYVFILEMEEGGGRVRRCVEFLDSKKTADEAFVLMGRGREWVDRVEGGGGKTGGE